MDENIKYLEGILKKCNDAKRKPGASQDMKDTCDRNIQLCNAHLAALKLIKVVEENVAKVLTSKFI